MHRLILLSAALILNWHSTATAQTLVQRIESLRMTKGHLPDAYLQNPQAAGLCWYFSTLGVHALALDGRHDREVRAYLDKYLGTATLPGGAINDVHDLTRPMIVWKVADSDDSYAATMLSLACWYAKRPGGKEWFASKLPQLKFIATANLLHTLDPDLKLTFTYNSQKDRFATLGNEKAPYQKVAQLMDNCEAYRGLRDLADQLASINDVDAGKYHKAAQTVAEGIAGMFDPVTKSFRVSTIPIQPVRFYPHRLIQVAPQVYGVDLGPRTKDMYDGAWAYLNAGGDAWWQGQIKNSSNQGAPMMLLAYAAVLRGEQRLAKAHLEFFESRLANRLTPPGFGAIHELGWALRAQRGR